VLKHLFEVNVPSAIEAFHDLVMVNAYMVDVDENVSVIVLNRHDSTG
jgi:hypothetical protein